MIEPCTNTFTVPKERYGFPFEVFCKLAKGHKGKCVGKATLDGVEIEIKFPGESGIGAGKDS